VRQVNRHVAARAIGIAAAAFAMMGTVRAAHAALPPVRAEHPRLWLHGDKLVRLRLAVAANSARWQSLKRACDGSFGSSSPYEVSVPNFALVYQLTGNPAYARKAIALMQGMVDKSLAAITYDSGYGVRTVLPAMAMGYDWCYDQMTPAQRTTFRRQMETWADWVWPETNPARATAWGVRLIGNNYYHGFMTTWLVGLALHGESPKAAGYIENALRRWHEEVRPYLDRYGEGGYLLEGTNYGPASVFRIFQYLSAHQSATGEDLLNVPGFAWPRQSIIAKLYLTAPTMDRAYPGADQSRVASAPLADQDRHGVMAALSHLQLDATTAGYGRWWLDHIKPNPTRQRSELWVEFLYYRDDITPVDYTKVLSTEYLAGGSGFMTSRSDWGPDATYVTMQCGPTKENHQDLAQNAFMIFRKEWLTSASRITSESGLFRGTSHHNTITIGDQGQPEIRPDLPKDLPQVVRFVDPSEGYDETERYAYFEGEAKDAYTYFKWPNVIPVLNGFRRHLMFLKPGRVILLDRVDAIDPMQVKKWHLHTINEPARTPDGWRASAGGSTMFVQTLLPRDASFAKVPLYLGDRDALSSWRLDIAAPVGQNLDTFLNVLEVGPARLTDPSPVYLVETGRPSLIGVQVGNQSVLFDTAPASSLSYRLGRLPALEHFVLNQEPEQWYEIVVENDGGERLARQFARASKRGVLTFPLAVVSTGTLRVARATEPPLEVPPAPAPAPVPAAPPVEPIRITVTANPPVVPAWMMMSITARVSKAGVPQPRLPVRLELRTDAGPVLTRTRQSNAKGEFLLRFRPSAPGNYTVTATVTPPGQGPISSTTTFTVERPRPRRGWSLTSSVRSQKSAKQPAAVRVTSRR
jgi:hypothetical protein